MFSFAVAHPDPIGDAFWQYSLFGSQLSGLFFKVVTPDYPDGSGRGTGIHIHIEDSVLDALLEHVPWTEVLESLNNKLSRTEETKHIREHIYKTALDQDISDHRQWTNGHHHNRYNFQAFHRRKLQSASPSSHVQQVARQRQRYYCQQPSSQWQRKYCPVQLRDQPQLAPAPTATKPQVFRRTWRRGRGSSFPHQEYTFRHTIIQRIKKPEKRAAGFLPYRQHHTVN